MLSEKISDVFYEKPISEAIEAACELLNNFEDPIMVYDTSRRKIDGQGTWETPGEIFRKLVIDYPDTMLNAIEDDDFDPSDWYWILRSDEGLIISTSDIIPLLYEYLEDAEEQGWLTEDDVKEYLKID